MSVQIESLFTAALGLQAPWTVERVDLSTAKRRIDFEVTCKAKLVSCPHCGATEQGIHDRMRRKWRHLDFFQFEAWLNAEVVSAGVNPLLFAGEAAFLDDAGWRLRIEEIGRAHV